MSPRGREVVRRKIVAAALDLFGSEGFEQTTVRMIARRCGVTDALLYYYFPSKRHILNAIWEIPQARLLHAVDPNKPLTVEGLMALVDQMVSGSIDMDAILRVMIRQALSGDGAAVAFRQRTMKAWRRDVQAHFATVLPKDEAELNTDLVTSIVFGATFPAMAATGANYPAIARTPEFLEAIRQLVLIGLPFCRDRGEP
ncbi:MAG: TetR/AcrR family transcriptional regulator [Dehalococcoidia bacterium]